MIKFALVLLLSINVASADSVSKAPGKDIKYTLRSNGSDFFLCDTSDGKILKCTGSCSGLIGENKGLKLEFLENFKLVEFQTFTGSHSCQISGCSEIKK